MNEIDALTNCPKCGFEQPVDTYCAKCGVDMTSLPKKSPSIATKPSVLASGALVLILGTVFGIRTMRQEAPTPTERTASSLASEANDVRRERLSAPATRQIRENLETPHVQKTVTADSEEHSEPVSETRALQEPAGGSAAAAATVPGAVTGAVTGATMGAAATSAAPAPAASSGPAQPSASQFKNIEVDFMWADVPREMLQAFHAMSPGLHHVPNLKARLRTVPGIVVTGNVRQAMDASETIGLDFNRGDRIATHFELSPSSGTTVQGTIQISVRAPDGSIRTPPPLPLSLEKDQGGILTFTGPILGLGSAQTATEIVVFILPRWGADRNP